MSIQKRTIALLCHATQRDRTQYYHVWSMAEQWRADGHDVIELYGLDRFVPADLVFVHVDLSVVPDDYLEFAKQYPISVNGRVKDIRKSSISSEKLSRSDSYAGKVMVKSNLNYAGVPERVLGVARPSYDHGISFEKPTDYRIYDQLSVVPESVFEDDTLIVERFVPEIKDGRYYTRVMQFLGDRIDCIRFVAETPIVSGSTGRFDGLVEPHPDIVAARERLNFDFGKFDFVIHEGRAILLDTNKTVGAQHLPVDQPPEVIAVKRERAKGIYDYFK